MVGQQESSFWPHRIEDPDRPASSESAPIPEISHINPALRMESHGDGLGESQTLIVFSEKWPVIQERSVRLKSVCGVVHQSCAGLDVHHVGFF